jgi:hypothetical protein
MHKPRLEGRESYTHFGLYASRDFLKRLDTAKGPYYSRNRYIVKILEEHLNENESKNLNESRIEAPATQSAQATTTTLDTTTDTTATSGLMTSTGSSSTL